MTEFDADILFESLDQMTQRLVRALDEPRLLLESDTSTLLSFARDIGSEETARYIETIDELKKAAGICYPQDDSLPSVTVVFLEETQDAQVFYFVVLPPNDQGIPPSHIMSGHAELATTGKIGITSLQVKRFEEEEPVQEMSRKLKDEIFKNTNDFFVTKDFLKALSLTQIVDGIRRGALNNVRTRRLAAELDGESVDLTDEEIKLVNAVSTKPPTGAGKPRLPDEYLRSIALEYLELDADGKGQVIVRLADNRRCVFGTMRDHVTKSRDRGFLTSQGPGKMSVAGPKLQKIRKPSP